MENIKESIKFKRPMTSKECYNTDCYECIYIHKEHCPVWTK